MRKKCITPQGLIVFLIPMFNHPSLICAAGKAVVPSYLALKNKGYDVQPMSPGTSDETWWAEKDGLRSQAGNVVELLGLVVRNSRCQWQAANEEIDEFLNAGGS